LIVVQTLSGVVVPVITPLDSEDRVDEPAFRKLLRRLIESGVHALFVGGSAGEGPLLTLTEWTRMMEIAHSEVGDALPLLGGVMETSSRRIAEKMHLLRQIGYAHYVVTPAFYFPFKTEAEHLRLFEDCKAADGGMNLIPYNLPSIVKTEIPLNVLLELARRGWVTCCKESSGNPAFFRPLIAAGREVGLRVLVGDELTMVEGLRAGAVGVVPSSANVEAQPFIAACRAAIDGDEAALNSANERIQVLRDALPLAGAYWVTGVKYALACLGIGTGKTIAPYAPLTAEQQHKIEAFVKTLTLYPSPSG
jgi:4-hydroxy-tetrahydrodipicolinate synthase